MNRNIAAKRFSVPSGSFTLGTKKNEILDAYLGTCVGVTLVDEKAGKGGLMHILLPEPSGMSTLGKAENYASTGLPLFINALKEEIGDNGNISAVVAGGALVGPVSDLDLNLDIGGRTSEIVLNILKEEKIPVVKSETGGYFSCRLSLDLSNWESSIKPISVPSAGSESTFEKPSLKQLESTLSAVKPIPQIALKLMRMIQDENYSMGDLGGEIKQDQIISAKVIRLCNSAYFNHNSNIDSIDRALVVLGEKRLLQMIVSASMEGFFTGGEGGYSLCKGGLFNHAVGTAMISAKLASYNKKISSDIAYTAGLLHDIGKIALDQFMNSAYPMFYRRIQQNGEPLIDVEKEMFGLTHTEAGGRLSEAWDLPDRLAEVIKYHHRPEDAAIDSELSHLVYMGDLIMSRFIVGQDLERLNTNSLGERLNKIGIRPEEFSDMIGHMSEIIYNLSS